MHTLSSFVPIPTGQSRVGRLRGTATGERRQLQLRFDRAGDGVDHVMEPLMSDVNTLPADGGKAPRATPGGEIEPRVCVGRPLRIRPTVRAGLAIHRPIGQGRAVPCFLSVGAPGRGDAGKTHHRRLLVQAVRQAATILVVDDDPRMRRLARRMLSESGYRVVEAENAGAAARLLATDVSVDLLFTDVVMPGEIDGRALGHWARKARPGLPVLLTSGFDQHRADAHSGDTESLPLLGKPFSKQQLQAAVQTLLRTPGS